MKKLIISLKTSATVLYDFKHALKKKKLNTSPHYEISFDKKKDFNKFVRNIDLLMLIIHFKPSSVYELSKIANKDVSNLNKIIRFFEEIGVIEIKKRKVSGREVKTPVVQYERIEFDIAV